MTSSSAAASADHVFEHTPVGSVPGRQASQVTRRFYVSRGPLLVRECASAIRS
jgi:hypothetical protein